MEESENHGRQMTGQGGELEYQAAQASVLLCAISALVESHPAPEAFARAFHAQWQRLGSPNQSAPEGSQSAEGFDEALSVLEGACSVRLGIRPPGVAQEPGLH